MKLPACVAVLLLTAGMIPAAAALATDADDDDRGPPHTTAKVGSDAALTTQQRDALGVVVAHPTAMQLVRQAAAFGEILDTSSLVAEFGLLQAAAASERAAGADLARLQGLYHAEAASSLKMVQAAQAEQIRARTQYQAASATFTAHWGALAKLPVAQRDRLIEEVASGAHLLVRASLLGRRSVDAMPVAGSLQVDGVRIPARVIGALAQSSAEFQNAAWLLEVNAVPSGLGPGARVPVTLDAGVKSGELIPDAALIYAEQGAHVLKQVAVPARADEWRYSEIPVELLQRQATGGWLVSGVAADDWIVVGGAGALWSLQSANVAAADDDD